VLVRNTCCINRHCLKFTSLFYSGESAAEETAIGLKIGEEDQRLENEKVKPGKLRKISCVLDP
jgi:hypothetical protein